MTKWKARERLEYLLSIERGIWKSGNLSPEANEFVSDNIEALKVAIRSLKGADND